MPNSNLQQLPGMDGWHKVVALQLNKKVALFIYIACLTSLRFGTLGKK